MVYHFMGEKDRGSSWVLVEQDKLLISILLFQCFNQSQIFCQTQKSIFDPVQDLSCWVLQTHQLRQIWFLPALVIPILMSWRGGGAVSKYIESSFFHPHYDNGSFSSQFLVSDDPPSPVKFN